jgi:hypothetical protein
MMRPVRNGAKGADVTPVDLHLVGRQRPYQPSAVRG